MNKDQKELLKRLDVLNDNIELLAKVIAVNVGKEVLFEEKKQKEQQIAFLSELGLPRNIIASMVVTTPLTVSVTVSQKKPKQRTTSEKTKIDTKEETPKGEKSEKSGEN
jgi:ABC-type cobalamin transport system permease subunit